MISRNLIFQHHEKWPKRAGVSKVPVNFRTWGTPYGRGRGCEALSSQTRRNIEHTKHRERHRDTQNTQRHTERHVETHRDTQKHRTRRKNMKNDEKIENFQSSQK